MDNCCGKCKHHVKEEIMGDVDWICNNEEAEEYGIETPYSHLCDEFEKRGKKNEESDF